MLTSLEIVTAPSASPVTLTEQKDQSRVDFTADDTPLQFYVDAATDYLDGEPGALGRAIMPQVWDWRVTEWAACIVIPLPPTRSIVEVAYLHSAGGSPSETVVSASDYRLIPGTPAAVFFKESFSWPALIAEPQNVRIRMNAGYADAASVPDKVKQAIRLLAEHWYAHRSSVEVGAIPADVPQTVQMLINSMKVYR